MNNKKRLSTIIIAIVAVAALVGVIYFLMHINKNSPVNEEPEEMSVEGDGLANFALAFSEDGNLALRDIKDGRIVDKFDLKTLSIPREMTIEKVVEQPKVEAPKPDPEKAADTYKDFEQIRVTIVKHDNAWNIQSKLTPKRNTITMLRYVRELNDGYDMHPIYPGEQYIFLKEKGETGEGDVDEEEIGIKIEEVIQVPENKEPEVVKETKMVTEDHYIFHKDLKNDVLYAHSDVDMKVYKVKVKKDKLDILPIEVEDIGTPDRFIAKVTEEPGSERFFFTYHENPEAIFLKPGEDKKVIELFGQPDNLILAGDYAVYSFDKSVASYNVEGSDHIQAVIGDTLKELIHTDDQTYALNIFGSDENNSLLMQFDPETLYISRLLELEGDRSSIVSYGDEKKLFISRVKEGVDHEGSAFEEDQVTEIHTGKMTVDKEDWKVPFLTNGEMDFERLYTKNGDTLDIFVKGESKMQNSIELTESDYLLVD